MPTWPIYLAQFRCTIRLTTVRSPCVLRRLWQKKSQMPEGQWSSYTYPGDDHNLGNSFSLSMTRTIAFFDQYFKIDSPFLG